MSEILKKAPRDHKQTENHKLSFYVLFIITKGEGIHTINYKDYAYKKGTIFSLRKGVIHKFTKSEADGKLLVFTEDFIIQHIGRNEGLKSLLLFNELIESPKIQLDKSIFLEVETILEQFNAEVKTKNDMYTSSVNRSLLHVLLSKLYREKTKGKKAYTNTKYLNQFLKFQRLIEEQWFESRTALYYAKQMSITPKTLNNIVKGTIEKSAKSLIDEIVITQVKRLLVSPELSIVEIAYQSGFDDPANFFKYFKKHTSLSPSQFREKYT